MPLGQRDAGAARTLNVPIAMWTPLTDPTYATKGKEIIHKILKMVVLRDRLMFCWVETGGFVKAFWNQKGGSLIRFWINCQSIGEERTSYNFRRWA